MPDFVKKTKRPLKKVARDDEVLQAALFVRPTEDGETKRLGTPGALADKDGPSGQDMASSIPKVNMVLALTNERLIGFRHGALLGRVHDLQMDFERAEVQHVQFDETPTRQLTLYFTDESSIVFTPGSRVQRFVKAYLMQKAASSV